MAIEISTQYQSESVARAYDATRFTSAVGRAFHNLECRAIQRALTFADQHHRPEAVLDAPCGTGRITELLVGRGYNVTGADISPAMMRVAAERLHDAHPAVSFLKANLESLDLPDRAFDLVTCIRLFHHLDTSARTRILSELARVSRRFVLANFALSTPFYRTRRRVKTALGGGISRQSSTWQQIRTEAAAARLIVEGVWYACRYVSEDVIVLMSRADA